MTAAPVTPELRALAPAFAGRLAVILLALAALVARRFLRVPGLAARTVPLCKRLARARLRLARIMDRLAAGAARPAPLPRGRAWLVRALGHEAAALAGQLDALLAAPEAAQLLAAARAAGHVLRPICHMLGLRPAALPRPAARPSRPRPEARPAPAPEPHPPERPTPARPAPSRRRFHPGAGPPFPKPA
jgi:hypothetical protein